MRLALLILALALASTKAQAAPLGARRFALVIGHDQGHRGEERLRFARSDAERVASALRDVGGVAAGDVVRLVDDGDDAFDVIKAFDELDARVRAAESETQLLVYYSGHADPTSLHLGASALPLAVLDEKMRNSGATVRVLVLDACRAGTLTRVKGDGDDELAAAGYAVLTASTANEDAAESDELQGSFFTHAFVAGLRGAADDDGDQRVTLDEAYRHAFAQTVRRSTAAATVQHPTFRYELRGRKDVVLADFSGARSQLLVPSDVDVIVFDGGHVVVEVARGDVGRSVAVDPGVYDVVVRARDAVYEGAVVVEEGAAAVVDLNDFTSSSYARLVRKGGSDSGVVVGVGVGGSVIGYGDLASLSSLSVAVPVALALVTVTPRLDLGYGRDGDSPVVPGRVITIDRHYASGRLVVAAGPVVDLPGVTLGVDAFLGLQGLTELTIRNYAGNGDGLGVVIGPVVGAGVGAQLPFLDRWFVDAGVESSLWLIGSSVKGAVGGRLQLGLYL